jgi:hypothetical protein
MTGSDVVEREEIAVQFVAVADGSSTSAAPGTTPRPSCRCAAATSGACSIPRRTNTAPASRCSTDDLAAGLEAGTLPGGRYLRARLRGDLRRIDEIDLLLPIT